MELDWETLTKEQRLERIRATVEAEVAPFLAQDGGGLSVVDLLGDSVKISYEGACAGCPMALSGTLSFIQHVITTKVHPSLKVCV